MKAKLNVSQLSCERQGRLLFKNINFTVSNGEGVYIQGHNGSGKTSLLKILAGLISPASGQVLWNNTPIQNQLLSYYSAINYQGHQFGLKDKLTTVENLKFSLNLIGRHDPDKIAKILTEVGLENDQNVYTARLSAGQKQRLALARAIASEAQLWLLDEPFSSLDQAGRRLIEQKICYHIEQGGLVVLSSHIALSQLTGFKIIEL